MLNVPNLESKAQSIDEPVLTSPLVGKTPTTELVHEFLSSQDCIRVIVPNTHRFGLQGSSLNLMANLDDLGYAGRIEVAYASQGAEKLPLFFPFFSPSVAGSQTSPDGRVELVSWDTLNLDLQSGNRKQLTLGLCGGTDIPLSPEQFGVNAVAWLNPAHWHVASGIRSSGSSNVISLEALDSLSIPQHTQRLHSFQEAAGILGNKFANFQTLAQCCDKGESLPIYGLRMRAHYVLCMLASALNKYLPESTIFMPVFEDFGPNTKPLIEKMFRDNPSLRERTKVLALSDVTPDTVSSDSKSIIVVLCGRTPQAVFHYFLEKASLPPTLFGVSTANFMAGMGRPYIPLTKEMVVSLHKGGFHEHEGFTDFRRVMAVMHELLPKRIELIGESYTSSSLWQRFLSPVRSSSKPVWRPRPDHVAMLVTYLEHATDHSSKLGQLFQDIQQQEQDPRNNKLIRGLLEVKRILEESSA